MDKSTIRNVGTKRPNYARVIAEPALELSLRQSAIEWAVGSAIIDDLSSPSHVQTDTKANFRKDLESILSGKVGRWKLWECEPYRDRLLLRYLDTSSTKKTLRSAIAVTIPYCDGFEAKIDATNGDYRHLTYHCGQQGQTSKFVLSSPVDDEHYLLETSEICHV